MFWVTDVFGFDSSSNFVFFCGILVLLARLFTQDLKVAMRKRKLTTLTQTEALKEHGGVGRGASPVSFSPRRATLRSSLGYVCVLIREC